MKNFELDNFMIVRDGFKNLYIVLKGETHQWMIVRDLNELEQKECDDDCLGCFEWSDFNEDLVHKENLTFSITEVYESLSIKPPFDLCVNDLFEEYKPKLLWKREPSLISHSVLRTFKTAEDMSNYLDNFVPPYIIVD